MKTCTKCLSLKELSEFHKMKHGKFGVKDHCKECTKKYFESKPRKCRPHDPEYFKNYHKNQTLEQKIAARLRTRLCLAIKNDQKIGSAIEDLGCSIGELKIYLESKFKDGMSWDNYGINGWHIDHIFPLSKIDFNNQTEIKKACHFTNLQPLWAKENLSKRDKLVG